MKKILPHDAMGKLGYYFHSSMLIWKHFEYASKKKGVDEDIFPFIWIEMKDVRDHINQMFLAGDLKRRRRRRVKKLH